MTRRPLQRLLALALGLSTWGVSTALVASGLSQEQTLKFAADMAEQGNWREAQYRWGQVAAKDPSNASVVNNLAVAAEATGRLDEALDLYARALTLSGGDDRIRLNEARARRLREEIRRAEGQDEVEDGADGGTTTPPPSGVAGKPKGGKPLDVMLGIPIAPPIDVESLDSVLVASFLTQESSLLDINRELVRMLRGEFRKRTGLEVIDAVPPPAIPEQRPDDLAQNAEFWKHLGREYDADLIVSGAVQYTRRDVSGFKDVDIVDPMTGQKVRQTRFVEEEEFTYAVDVMFFDGATGALLNRNRVRRGVSFRGLMNDPIHAFYEIGESIGDEVMSAVVARIRSETRTIFRK
jgi:tetratricopeptide (TPR) repeat protein